MLRKTILPVMLAAMVVLAGCGFLPGGGGGGGQGSVAVYLSDRPNAIDDFRHLNATVTSVSVHRVDNPRTSANESGWTHRKVGPLTVDLTKLQGKNATKLGALGVPAGAYSHVVVHVRNVSGTLTTGETANVTLPSNDLRVLSPFTVAPGQNRSFVFDLAVHEAAGGYVLRPVASQSGADEEFTRRPGAKVGQPGSTATVEYFVSDEQGAIDQFAHLNATVTAIGVHRAGVGNDTGGWVTKPVDNVSVDLAKLHGANATSLGLLDVSSGTYTMVMLEVSNVSGTLESGEHVDVTLPSERLRLNERFTVGPNSTAKFVFDVAVFERGTGSYILRPVAAESGTASEVGLIERPDAKRGVTQPPAADGLNLSVSTPVVAGENVTVTVARDGAPVENVTVVVNGAAAGTTGPDGSLAVQVPADAARLTVVATADDARGTFASPVSSPSTAVGALDAPGVMGSPADA